MRLRFPSGEQFLFVANIVANKLFFSSKIVNPPERILVVKWDEIGDMATATHVFGQLKSAYPASELTVLCKPFVKGLIANDPQIDHILTEISGFSKPYEMVVELRGTWKTLFKAIRYKARYRVSRAEVRLRHKGKQLHEVDTNLEVIKPVLRQPPDPAFMSPVLYFSDNDARQVNLFLSGHNIQKFAILHAGARRKLRQWDLDKFALAAKYLHGHYGLEIIFAGSAEDRADIAKINTFLDFRTFDFTEGFSLSQFAYLCSRAAFYIGNESGPLHIASAFHLPLIGLFGPGVPYVFYPRSEKAVVLHHVLSCNPCDQVHCVHPENPCISRIMANDVLEKIDEILHK